MKPDHSMQHTVNVELSLGHVLMLCQTLSDRLSALREYETWMEEERRAVWALQDTLDRALARLGYDVMPSEEWDSLLAQAQKHMYDIHVECLD